MKIELPLDGTARERLRGVSKGVFQNKYEFEVVLVIAQRDRFYPSEVAGLAGCAPNQAGQIIDRLAAADLVEPLEKEPGQARNYFRRRPSSFWDLAFVWAEELLQQPDAGVRALPRRG